jgi:hypothetical protein
MSKPLPTGDFKWEHDENYYLNISDGRGCIIECDLEYTEECKNLTSKYPLAPERSAINRDDLSSYQKRLLGEETISKVEKLLLTLKDKKKYVIHTDLLKLYISLGMKVTKVYRTISFKQEAWLKPYIDFNTSMRTKATSEFEKDFWKLMNNSFYGKTLENVRGRVNIKLINKENKKEAIKLFSKPTFTDVIDFSNYNDEVSYFGILNVIPSIKFNKPIYTGMCILDYSKLLMYDFYYNIFNKKIPDNEVLYFDTDAWVLTVYTNDLITELKKIEDYMDTSNYPKDHELYSETNKKVIGKFKDENAGTNMSTFIGLRSKSYAIEKITGFNNELEENIKLKGIGYSAKKDIHMKDFYNCLLTDSESIHKMYTLNPDKHEMYINEINKKSLGPYDDKRYIYKDGITTAPFE